MDTKGTSGKLREVVHEVDLCVAGGGVAGVTAALQAARAGARTVLMEMGSQVGGTLSSGGVNWPGLFHAWGRQIIAGCGWDLVAEAVALSGGTMPDFSRDVLPRHWLHQVRVSVPVWVALAEEKLAAAGVRLLYHAAPVSARAVESGWRLRIALGGKLAFLDAAVLVDATGNGALAALCGARRMRDEASRQPGSFAFLIDPHAESTAIDIASIERNRTEAIADGRLLPADMRNGVKAFVDEANFFVRARASEPEAGLPLANYVADADNTTAESRAATNMAGRAMALRVLRFLRAQPGLERATLVATASEVGVRETWRVEGDYVITGRDYVSGRRFRDAVCYAFYPVDLHDAATGIHPKQLAPDVVPTVPLRALCAKGVPRLLVAGRCVSSDRAANSGLRVQAACMATGQAAGEAAALAAASGLDPRDVPLGELRRRLAASGHIVPVLSRCAKLKGSSVNQGVNP
ncbi:MAG: FAD-dependent oxidoreductase [Kiritimatiellae bacterium]|nr:FAD-dependent oxidoreductase [Kiritimatiellia bacterium]